MDFGCGAAATPSRREWSAAGVASAMDCDLERMQPVAKATRDLNAIHGDGTTKIPLEDKSCDVGLLFDVLRAR